VSLAFYRWSCATIVLFPFAYKKVLAEYAVMKIKWKILLMMSFTGIALFNTFVYVAGHYTTAINMALIGTTSSPIFATVMAVLFLKERIGFFRIIGMIISIFGIVLLISKGSWDVLKHFQFSIGDAWILAGAFAFAVYNILVRKKPSGISPLSFLWIIFCLGSCMLLPFYLLELNFSSNHTSWSAELLGSILYLGIGASVLAFWCWNLAIAKLGAGKTVLFGNLIPIFSTLEAVFFIGEKLTLIHLASGVTVIAGLIIANLNLRKRQP
jgi:drug/metabolite transporter (DMT)-like permease